jgi:DNA-binding SARP family transcriptional activator
MAQGRWPALQQWIGDLPAALRDGEPWLRYWQGCCLLMSNPPAGRKELEAAYAKFETTNNNVGQVLAASTLIECYGIQFADVGQADPWIDALNRLVMNGVKLPPDMEVRVRVNLLVGLLSRRPNDPQLQHMDAWIEQFLAAEIDPAIKMQLFIWLFPYAYWHSNAVQIRRITELVERLSMSPQATPLSQVFGMSCLMFVQYDETNFQRVIDLYRHGYRVTEEFGLSFCAPLLNAHYLQISITHGEFVLARKTYQENLSLLAASSDSTSFGHFQLVTARLAAVEGNRRAVIAAARDFKMRIIDTGAISGPMLTDASTLIAQALHEVRAINEARDILQSARRALSPLVNKFPVLDAQLHFIEAACDLDEGKEREGLAHLRSGLGIAVANDYLRIPVFACSRSLGARLCTEALVRGIEPNYARKYIQMHRFAPPSLQAENWPWRVRICALGKFNLIKDDEPLKSSGKSQQRVLDLLKALIAFGVRDVNIDRLSAALWPDAEGDAAKRAFDVTLHRLRKLLGVEQAVLVSDAKVSINTDLCWVDTLALEQVLEQANGEPSGVVERVMKLYRGHFLQDQKEHPWLFEQRERLAGKVFRCLDAHGTHQEQAGDVDGAIDLYRRVVELDPLAEPFYRKLMSCHMRMNRRADALAAYRRCQQMLSATLGVKPSPETESLHAELNSSA